MDISRAISEINASFDAAVRKHMEAADFSGAREIRLSEPFFGSEWGVAGWNVQRQKWRWLGPRGQSHLYLKLDPSTDHLIRIFVHTTTSEHNVEAMTVLANGVRCTCQGVAVESDGVRSKWCIVGRELLERHGGIAKITWSLPPVADAAHDVEGSGAFRPARSIAFSHVTCEPYRAPVVRRGSVCDIELTQPFPGSNWGGVYWNVHGQKGLWLGPNGQSHLYLNLDSDSDHRIRIHVYTGAPEQLIRLAVLVNGARCRHQGLELIGSEEWTKWCIIRRETVRDQLGAVKITWSLLPTDVKSRNGAMDGRPAQPCLTRSIALTRVACEPISRAAANWEIGVRAVRRSLRRLVHAARTALMKDPGLSHDGPILRSIRH